MAAGLQARGVRPGDHVAILGPTTRPLVTAIQATWLTGATVVMLPAPDAHGLARGVHRPDPRPHPPRPTRTSSLVDSELAAFIEPGRGRSAVRRARRPSRRVADLGGLRTARTTTPTAGGPPVHLRVHVRAEGRDAPAPQRSATTSTAPSTRPTLNRDDVLVSWLPLYHDMGLIGLLTIPMTTGHGPRARRPAGLPRQAAPVDAVDLATSAAPCTAGPELLLRARRPRAAPGRGRSTSRAMRIALNGAEPVDADSFRAFLRGRCPLRPRPGRAVPGLRHGRGVHRRHVPRAGHRHADRPGRRPGRSRPSASPRPSTGGADAPASSPCWASPIPGLEHPRRRPAHRSTCARPRGRRAPDPRQLGHRRATTSAPTRPPSCSSTAGSAPATSPTWSTASWSCAAASRT